MMEHLHPTLRIVFYICFLVAGIVFFFWLRELDLTFMVTYRIPVGILIATAGIMLGALFGFSVYQSYRSPDGKKQVSIANYVPSILFAAACVLAIVIGFIEIPHKLIAYWHAAQQMPKNFTLVTDRALSVLSASFVWPFLAFMFITYYLEARERRQAAPASN
ncbi:MAG: hypothetical protein ACYDCO_28095 [Armatimonadota bacterium]